jgi:hypothetical protein
MRKRILGQRIKQPPVCGKTFCQNCLQSWYTADVDQEQARGSCPVCLRICFCSRCNRFENIERLSQILEGLGGDIDKLAEDSPASHLATFFLESNPSIKRQLEIDFAAKKNKPSSVKKCHVLKMNQKTLNDIYRQLHLLKLTTRLVKVRGK